jgi:phage/conjugal plasmid C-4 type zinc finger TraR family protein
MTDVYDQASVFETRDRALALARHAARADLAGKTMADSARVCAVCGDRIPAARRRAIPGVQTCVDCQHDLERAARGSKC